MRCRPCSTLASARPRPMRRSARPRRNWAPRRALMRWCGWRSGRRRSEAIGSGAQAGYIPEMTQIMISMPPALQSWVEAQIAAGRYTDAADYLRDLVRRDRESAEAD